MDKKAVIDTNAILSLLLERENTEETKRILEKLINQGYTLYLTQQAIAETVYVLQNIHKTGMYPKLSKQKISYLIRNLIFSRDIFETEREKRILKALKLYEEENADFGDALICATALEKKIKEVFTFDLDFERLKLEIIK
jgi:predicted nucleic acid-binding protein